MAVQEQDEENNMTILEADSKNESATNSNSFANFFSNQRAQQKAAKQQLQ